MRVGAPVRSSTLFALLAALPAAMFVGCTPPETTASEPQKLCKLDTECGSGRYCTVSGVCRRDCTIDAHCYGPGTSAQCNTQGKCLDTVDAAEPPPLEDGGPRDTRAPTGDAKPATDAGDEPDVGLDPPEGGGGA